MDNITIFDHVNIKDPKEKKEDGNSYRINEAELIKIAFDAIKSIEEFTSNLVIVLSNSIFADIFSETFHLPKNKQEKLISLLISHREYKIDNFFSEIKLLGISDDDLEKIIKFLRFEGASVKDILNLFEEFNIPKEKILKISEELNLLIEYCSSFGMPQEIIKFEMCIKHPQVLYHSGFKFSV